MGTGESNAGGNPATDWYPTPGGSRNTPSRLMPQKPEISAGLIGPSRLVTDFTLCKCRANVMPYLILKKFFSPSQDIDECKSASPYKNCVNKHGGYTCNCNVGFTGKLCEKGAVSFLVYKYFKSNPPMKY